MSDIVKATELKIDLSKITAKEFPVIRRMGDLADLFAKVVTQCPWGPAKSKATWLKLNKENVRTVAKLLQDERQALDKDTSGYVLNLENLTLEEMDAVEAATNNPQAMAKVMEKLLLSSANGKVTATELLGLPYYTRFLALFEMVSEACSDEIKSFL